MAIAQVNAWEALDSRGRPTVACEVGLRGGATGTAIVPSGASRGSHEAHELRDHEERYGGLGVRHAVSNVVGALATAVRGLDARDQRGVDDALRSADGTQQLERLGANSILAVSIATSIAAAAGEGVPLYQMAADGTDDLLVPMPMVNIVSGGAHAGGGIDLQDVLVVPVGARTFSEAIEWAVSVRSATAAALEARGLPAHLTADEGGLGPALSSNRLAIEIVAEGIERAGLRVDDDVAVALDLASTEFYDVGHERYHLSVEGRSLSRSEWIDEVSRWVAELPVVSVEDVMAEDDWDGWTAATAALAAIQVIGDDLFVTDVARLERGISSGAANAVLVKPNQVGTLTDAHSVVCRAQAVGYATVLSARSGDTEDSWLADLAVAWRTGQIKVGSTTRSERTAKWNRLLRIEAEAGERASFAGRAALLPALR